MRELTKNLAFEAASALVGNPSLADLFRRRPLPDGVTEILHVLADRETGQINRDARLKLEFYVQNILLFNGASSYRILGVNPGASRDDMRTNMRLLMLWLHPDAAGGDVWRTAFAPRVISAWREVSTNGGEGNGVSISVPPHWAALKRRRGAPRGSALLSGAHYSGPMFRFKKSRARPTRLRQILRKAAAALVIGSIAFAATYFYEPLSQYAYTSGLHMIGSLSPW